MITVIRYCSTGTYHHAQDVCDGTISTSTVPVRQTTLCTRLLLIRDGKLYFHNLLMMFKCLNLGTVHSGQNGIEHDFMDMKIPFLIISCK